MSLNASILDTTLASLEPFIRSQAMRLCGPYSRFGWDWEDLAQAGRLAVANGLANDLAMDKGLLMRRAVFGMVDELRRLKPGGRLHNYEIYSADMPLCDGGEDLINLIPSTGPSPADDCAMADLLAKAERLLDEPLRSWVLALACGHSQAEIARAQGCTEGNISIRLSAARHSLRHLLQDRPEPTRASPRSPRVKAHSRPDMARPG